jgi:hypothetical protein
LSAATAHIVLAGPVLNNLESKHARVSPSATPPAGLTIH